ncbi:aldo/keto reductase [Cyanobium sp. T1B-Tous]|uniref:aldo/keto reductase n=1 Tax=Cyanobium sp. T1B-Tous TaxID=2823721 RepID=UPI0020CE630F|nr:aldo/keto reductase [Cyanobium sp. T1B-Tous]MCP9807329.1 aldo/keto reductase [Cyanobium sp. T1B-Tous]
MTNLPSKIGLGTAQWGLTYGISNHSGQTKQEEVSRILAYAKAVGIKVIDTARAYGESEQVLGKNDLADFKVITKIPTLKAQHIDHALVGTFLEGSFLESLQALGVERVQGLLVHDCEDLFSQSGEAIITSLQKLKTLGKVDKIGVSIYSSSQIIKALKLFTPDIVQLPFNVFDQRLLHDGTLSVLKDLGIEIHARSIFLQGLLIMKADSIPSYFRPWKTQLLAWNQLCTDLGKQPQHIALGFAATNSLIDQVIVGVEDLLQLVDLASFRLSGYDVSSLSMYAVSDERLLNPSFWSLQD